MATQRKKAPAPAPAAALDEEGQRLLDAVLADSTDLEPRLVFADWLSERGDPRGEFIHLQCALNRPVRNARGHTWANRPTIEGDDATLEKRERKLLLTHQKEWIAPIRPIIRTWNWSNGFVEKIVADCGKFLAGAPQLFAQMPISDIELTAMKGPMIDQLAAQPTTLKLRALNIRFQKLTAESLKAFESENWRNLEVLNLAGNPFGEAGAEVLKGLDTLTSLKRLILNDAHLTDEVIEQLSQAPFFKSLKTLELGWNASLTGRIAQMIGQRAHALEVLCVQRVELDTDALAALEHVPTIRRS